MSLSPYLTFDGNCGEAFEFYKSVFGGEFTVRQTFGDGPPEMGVSDEDKNKVMHVSLPIGDSVLMGSDTAGGYGLAYAPGNNFSISYAPTTKADADRIFTMLKEGGTETMAMQDTFWNAYFGMCTDKFGIQWMVNVDLGGA